MRALAALYSMLQSVGWRERDVFVRALRRELSKMAKQAVDAIEGWIVKQTVRLRRSDNGWETGGPTRKGMSACEV